jgi:tetratricopeptide (TPR) repeat protein
MICPNCGSNMSDKKKRCERCGTDMTIYRKIYRASNQYYNNGLARARVRDLSGAILSLKSSLELNKTNTNARNLLGLIYYEMGETVAALSEWVISRHFQPEENDADEYINMVQSNPTKLDALNQAIKRYNTALTLAKQGSDDLSIIQLKKVVSLNPHFIRAYHLLALLHMKQKENEKARRYLLKAARIDVTNTTTLRYLKELEVPEGAAKDPDSNPEADRTSTGAIMPISSYREDKPNIMVFVNLVIGIIIGIAVTAFLIVPTIEKRRATSPDSEVVDYTTSLAKIEEQEDTISSLQTEKTQLEQQIEALQGQIDSMKEAEDKDGIYDALLEATQLYLKELDKTERNRDYIPIADLLAAVEEAKYENADAVALAALLKEVTYPPAAESHYDTGHDLYSDGKYKEAIKELEKALVFNPEDVNAIYFTGRAYHRLDDKENAALYYNLVLTDFPDSNRASDAQNFLEQVQD